MIYQNMKKVNKKIERTVKSKSVECVCEGKLKDAIFHSDRRCSNKRLIIVDEDSL